MVQHSFRIDNIHCPSCEKDIKEVIDKQTHNATVRFLQDREIVTVESLNDFDLDAVVAELEQHGFIVSKDTPLTNSLDSTARSYLESMATSQAGNTSNGWLPKWASLANMSFFSKRRQQKRHAEVCAECGDGSADAEDPADGTAPEHDPETLDAFRAVFAVSGMTCASCSQSIVGAVKAAVPEVLDVSADPISGAAYVLVPSRDLINAAEGSIEDAGFEATLMEVLPISATSVKEFKITAQISGMTCSSCSASVTASLDGLPFVTRSKVEALSGQADIFTKEKVDLHLIKSAIEDVGYDVTFVGDYVETHSQQAQHRARTVTLKVSGIYCERCPSNVMESLSEWGDAVDILDAVSISEPYVKFTYLPSAPKLTIRKILDRLRDQNPDLEFEILRPKTLEELAAENQVREKDAITRRLKMTSLIAAPTSILMFSHKAMMNYKLMFVLATPVYFCAADIFHHKAIKEVHTLVSRLSQSNEPLLRKLFHFGSMNLLMSMGTSIAYWASIFTVAFSWFMAEPPQDTYFDSVIFLTFFLLVGRYLDIYSKIKTTSAVSMVSKVRPDVVELVVDLPSASSSSGSSVVPEQNQHRGVSTESRGLQDQEEASGLETTPVSIDLIEVGDIVAVFPGQRCAVDGVITRHGLTEFNESMLTGESLPVPKTLGDEVYAGTLNVGRRSSVMKVTAVGTGTLLNDIVDAVRAGQMQRAPIETYVEQITAIFVPIVVYLALIVWLVWYVISEGDILWSMQFAISTFVVACPCGIGLAAPTALYIGSGLAAKYGILARGGGEAFQEGARIDVMCFDKTGTITAGGDLRITDTSGAESDEAVQLAARLENDSVHPLATAIVEYARGRKLTDVRCDNTEQIEDQGRGIKAKVVSGQYSGKIAVLGNERVIRELAMVTPNKEQARLLTKWKSEGKSVVLLAIQNQSIILMLAAADQIRRESRAVIHHLQDRLHIQCWMISGDNEETAKAVGRKVGVPPDQIIAEVLPQQKADKIKELQMTAGATHGGRQYGRAIVGMIGDGINDAPALATSDVGVALGRGADIALSSSQFVLLREDLRGLPVLCEISKAVMFKVKSNFFWAAIYNIVAIPLAAGVFYPINQTRLDPVWASLAMALSSVSVMTSSLLLRRYRPSSDIS